MSHSDGVLGTWICRCDKLGKGPVLVRAYDLPGVQRPALVTVSDEGQAPLEVADYVQIRSLVWLPSIMADGGVVVLDQALRFGSRVQVLGYRLQPAWSTEARARINCDDGPMRLFGYYMGQDFSVCVAATLVTYESLTEMALVAGAGHLAKLRMQLEERVAALVQAGTFEEAAMRVTGQASSEQGPVVARRLLVPQDP